MKRQDHDIELKEALQNDIKIPEIVDGRMEEMYDKIRSGEVRMKQLKGGSQKKRLYRGLGIAAAAACLVIVLSGVFYVNPALAKDIQKLPGGARTIKRGVYYAARTQKDGQFVL